MNVLGMFGFIAVFWYYLRFRECHWYVWFYCGIWQLDEVQRMSLVCLVLLRYLVLVTVQ